MPLLSSLVLNKKATIEFVRGTEQDVDFYPSTDEIIDAVRNDLLTITKRIEGLSILDVGAGDARVLMGIAKESETDICKTFTVGSYERHIPIVKLMGIEQSSNLRALWDHTVMPVGSNLFDMSLLRIYADYTFCNPPFQYLESFLVKVISESQSKSIYFVAPKRWHNSEEILKQIKNRRANVVKIGDFSFENADRPVRPENAITELMRIDLVTQDQHGKTDRVDPMELWLKNTFKEKATESTKVDKLTIKERLSNTSDRNSLIAGRDYVDSLVNLYNHETKQITDALVSFSKLDTSTLAAIGITFSNAYSKMVISLEAKREEFWDELLSNSTEVQRYVGSKSVYRFSRLIKSNKSAEFTKENIRATIVWILKNAKHYNDDLFDSAIDNFICSANVEKYKSNRYRFLEGDWDYYSYNDGECQGFGFNTTKRLICTKWQWRRSYDGFISDSGTLPEEPSNLINDLLVLANNFGFPVCNFNWKQSINWESGKQFIFEYTDKNTGQIKPLMKVKAFKAGTMHFNFDRDFIQFINVEFGKRNGWIASAKEASEELNIDEETTSIFFDKKSILEHDQVNTKTFLMLS